MRTIGEHGEATGSRRLVDTYSRDESYHWEESAPSGRSLLWGHACSKACCVSYSYPTSYHKKEHHEEKPPSDVQGLWPFLAAAVR